MTADLDRLEALARAATPGPWEAYYSVHGDPYVAQEGRPKFGVVVSTAPDDYGRADAAYIAAVSPEVVLRLIERLRHLERALEAAEFGQAHTGWPCPGCAECEPA